jgi:secreted PhoX family phosphatase
VSDHTILDDEIDDLDDVSANPSSAAPFAEVVHARLSRRSVFTGGMLAAAGFLTSRLVADAPAAYAASARAQAAPAGAAGLLGYEPVPLGFGDEIVVPRGYTARPFVPWGTPILGEFPAFVPGTPGAPGREDSSTGNTAAEQAQQMGMHHDGMHFFPLGRPGRARQRGLLVVNHEYTDEAFLHTGAVQPDRQDPNDPSKKVGWTVAERPNWTAEMVRKSQAAHGVSVIEVRKSSASGQWELVRAGRNRRITATTPMAFGGPAAGHRLLRTSADPRGESPLGTLNNCAMGYTPWGTYLACEENFNSYFAVETAGDPDAPLAAYTAEQQQLLARYGGFSDSRFNWSTHDPRFQVTPQDPHEPHRFGWVVEIDPFNPASTPVKRTALGRVKHEGAFVHVTADKRVVVYMGDDQRNDYAYKFVSSDSFETLRARGRSPLDEGTLYVARFDDGTGSWLPLVHGQGPLTAENGFADQGDVLVKTRLAADALGATPMDRPEWTSVDPSTGMVYLTLTNNTARTTPNGPNPRALKDADGKNLGNPFGQIVRWEEAGGDHTATSFTWDLFLLAGQGRDSGDESTIAAEDAFGSPDGMWIDPDSRVWIQTDGRQPEGANDQMLAANPFVTDSSGAPEVKRFLTGVPGSEVTGVITTPDQRTMFVNIQHPGQGGAASTWPHDERFLTPRAATVVITKDDGGVIGT